MTEWYYADRQRRQIGPQPAEEIGAVTGWSYNRTRNLVGKGMADLRQSLRQQAD